jgi:hypothetical protein
MHPGATFPSTQSESKLASRGFDVALRTKHDALLIFCGHAREADGLTALQPLKALICKGHAAIF